jgi:hypothetical protein
MRRRSQRSIKGAGSLTRRRIGLIETSRAGLSEQRKSANRDSDGKIKRSSKAKYEFMKQSGYPKGRPGYVVDHIILLKKGGCDCPSNMQWQTKEEAKRKDKWE